MCLFHTEDLSKVFQALSVMKMQWSSRIGWIEKVLSSFTFYFFFVFFCFPSLYRTDCSNWGLPNWKNVQRSSRSSWPSRAAISFARTNGPFLQAHQGPRSVVEFRSKRSLARQTKNRDGSQWDYLNWQPSHVCRSVGHYGPSVCRRDHERQCSSYLGPASPYRSPVPEYVHPTAILPLNPHRPDITCTSNVVDQNHCEVWVSSDSESNSTAFHTFNPVIASNLATISTLQAGWVHVKKCNAERCLHYRKSHTSSRKREPLLLHVLQAR